MTPLGRATAAAAATALLTALAGGCDLFTPRPPRGSFTSAPPSAADELGCEVCGAPTRNAAVVYHVAGPASVKVGASATFTFYVATGTDKNVICEVPQPKADLPGWGVDAGATPPRLKLGLVMKSVAREESKPCPVKDRSAPPKSVTVERRITFPAAGTYTIEVAGFDGSRPLGMQYEPGPNDPPAPPKPSVPKTIEVTP